jgi:hypothetical protein
MAIKLRIQCRGIVCQIKILFQLLLKTCQAAKMWSILQKWDFLTFGAEKITTGFNVIIENIGNLSYFSGMP